MFIYSSLRAETATAIREIANKSRDMRVIKLCAIVLGAATLRNMPLDGLDGLSKCTNLY